MKSLILLTFLIKMYDATKYDDHQQNWERISRSYSITFENASDRPPRADARHSDNIQARNVLPAHGKCMMGFCEEVDGYPEETIKKLLDQHKQYESFFNMPVADVTSRISDEENSCNISSFVTYPRSAINVKNKRVLIASTDQYKQRIQIELCSKTDGPCAYSKLLPDSYETTCKQKYTTVPLISLDHSTKLKLDTFAVPSCCVCMFRAA